MPIARLRPFPSFSGASGEDREEDRDVGIVVCVAVDRDEVADAVLGREGGVMSFELSVVVGEAVEGDNVA